MARNSKAQDLLRVLGQKAPAPAPTAPKAAPRTAPERRPSLPRPARPGNAAPRGIRGKAIQLYLHPEDKKLIRELSVWLLAHRTRINDSLVIKSILRAAKTGPGLLAAYDDAVTVDGRLRARKPPKRQP
jgi:hypothetical protein